MTRPIWTVANGAMLLMFAFSAAVQVNDPDPLGWIGIYLAAALVCVAELRRRSPLWVPVAVALVALGWGASLWTRARGVPLSALFAEWEMRNLQVEQAREMYGLAIVALWMLAVAGAALRRRWAAESSRAAG